MPIPVRVAVPVWRPRAARQPDPPINPGVATKCARHPVLGTDSRPMVSTMACRRLLQFKESTAFRFTVPPHLHGGLRQLRRMTSTTRIGISQYRQRMPNAAVFRNGKTFNGRRSTVVSPSNLKPGRTVSAGRLRWWIGDDELCVPTLYHDEEIRSRLSGSDA